MTTTAAVVSEDAISWVTKCVEPTCDRLIRTPKRIGHRTNENDPASIVWQANPLTRRSCIDHRDALKETA